MYIWCSITLFILCSVMLKPNAVLLQMIIKVTSFTDLECASLTILAYALLLPMLLRLSKYMPQPCWIFQNTILLENPTGTYQYFWKVRATLNLLQSCRVLWSYFFQLLWFDQMEIPFEDLSCFFFLIFMAMHQKDVRFCFPDMYIHDSVTFHGVIL